MAAKTATLTLRIEPDINLALQRVAEQWSSAPLPT